MQRLLYISTARTKPTEGMLADILHSSRRNNARDGVTGLLIVGGSRFLQALEGPDLAVMTAIARIRTDPRHFAIVELARAPIEQRAFGSWAMGHQRGGAASATSTVSEAVAALIAPIEDPTLRAYFGGFAELHAAA